VTAISTTAAVLAIAREKRASATAASLGFYAFNVLLTLVVLSYVAFTLVGGGRVASAVQILTGVGPETIQETLDQVGGDAPGRGRAVAIAGLVAVWSSLRLFRAVESAFADIYDVRDDRPWYRRVRDSVFVLGAVTATVVAMGVIGALFLFRTRGLVWTALGPVVLWLALFVLFLPMYYTFSEPVDSVREVLPGTAVAATGWVLSAIGLQVYVGVSETVDLFGAVGALLLMLTWLYVVGLSITLGVILNALLADRIEPEREWDPFYDD